MKLTCTSSSLAYTGNFIILWGITNLPSKPTNGESYFSKSSGLRFNPLYKSGYIISAPFPWSTRTLLTSYPPIRIVTTKASSCGYNALSLSSSEKPKVSIATILSFLQAWLLFSKSGPETTDVTPEKVPASPLGLAKMTLIVPKLVEELHPFDTQFRAI